MNKFISRLLLAANSAEISSIKSCVILFLCAGFVEGLTDDPRAEALVAYVFALYVFSDVVIYALLSLANPRSKDNA